MHVGILGLGALGKIVAANLVAAGVRTTVWNRSPGPVRDLVAAGATGAVNVRAVFGCDIVLSLLFDDAAMRQVVLEDDMLAGAKPGTIHVGMSTISTALARDLVAAHAAHGLHYIAAPVFGRPEAAAAKALVIVTAGSADLLDRVEPVLGILGRTWRMGENPQQAHLAKLVGNFMLGCATETMVESAALVAAGGGDAAAFLDMMSETLLAAPIYRAVARTIAGGGSPRTEASLRISLKDVGLTRAEAAAAGQPTPLVDLLRAQLRAAAGELGMDP